MQVNWELLGKPADVAGAFQTGMQNGRALHRQWVADGAIRGALAGDASALRQLAAVDPQLAANVENAAYQRDERMRQGEARSALSDYVRSGQSEGRPARPQASALSGIAPPMLPPAATSGALSALGGSDGLMQPQSAPSPPSGSAVPQVAAPRISRPGEQPAERSVAFDRLATADPEMAMKVQQMDVEQRKAVAESLEKQMDIGGRVMSAVLEAPPEQQPEVYRQLRTQLESAGVIDLPDDWDPVAAQSRMRMGMTVLQAVGADQRERKLEWDIADDETDNARSDQDVTSRIGARQGQLANTRRGQDLADQRGRRVQDLTDRRTRRGQDLSDARGRRGQDVTDKRQREAPTVRQQRAGGKATPTGAIIVNPKTGQRMTLQNGKWVAVR